MCPEQLDVLLGKAIPLFERGYNAKEAAREMGISYGTVEHLRRAHSSGFDSYSNYRNHLKETLRKSPENRAVRELLSGGLEKAGTSLKSFVLKSGISQPQVSSYKSGRKFPSERSREKIYAALGIKPDYAEELIVAAKEGRIEECDLSTAVQEILENHPASQYIRKPEPLPEPRPPELPRIRSETPGSSRRFDYHVPKSTRMKDDYPDALVTLGDFTIAVAEGLSRHYGRPVARESASRLAEKIMMFFGFNDVIIDNVLASAERDVFYTLEDAGLLLSERDEIIRHSGRVWRISYWKLNKPNILKFAGKIKISERMGDSEENDAQAVYKEIDNEVWVKHARGTPREDASVQS